MRTLTIAVIAIIIACTLFADAARLAVVEPKKLNSTVGRSDSYAYFILALQTCENSNTLTMHGLWPQESAYKWPSYCTNEPFDENQVSDLLPQMQQVWMSCPEDHTSNSEFWSHEWSRHGTCAQMTQHSYFSYALQQYQSGNWQSQCSGESTCKVKVPKAN